VPEWSYRRRTYFEPFADLALNTKVRRAAILLGPRRVGKTVLIKQLVQRAIRSGYPPKSILYASIDTPIYSALRLESYVQLLPGGPQPSLVIFDEIQYLKGWEHHLKDLVDSYPHIKFVATGSAAAALRLKSKESGAGRFSEFMLPPLTFHEFLCFLGRDDELVRVDDDGTFRATDINKLNDAFVDYLNYGGYPEAVLNDAVRDNPDQFVRNDIIDKVLLKDLPALYGINDIQELNRLFSFLAYNAGNEASLENISQESGLTKPTIKRYVEYLESAFLIIKVSTVDQNCRSMKRERNFKVYLNNPSMRAALFNPVGSSDTTLIGRLAESAIFSQWQHSPYSSQLRYARWRNEGEVDVVYVGSTDRPEWAVEVKWSDKPARSASTLSALKSLINTNPSIGTAAVTTKTAEGEIQLGRLSVALLPTSLYCYAVGRNITKNIRMYQKTRSPDEGSGAQLEIALP
jgi:predicted AAA+ superfamily ATPase